MKIKQTLRKIVFGLKKEKLKWNDHKIFIPPPPPKEVAKIREMLKQVETWINSGEKELAKKHWILIADECRKYGTQQLKKQIKMEQSKELLKPRFEVIADYPYPKNHCYYKVGEIINTITEEDIAYCRKYPHLFKELKWFEHRN